MDALEIPKNLQGSTWAQQTAAALTRARHSASLARSEARELAEVAEGGGTVGQAVGDVVIGSGAAWLAGAGDALMPQGIMGARPSTALALLTAGAGLATGSRRAVRAAGSIVAARAYLHGATYGDAWAKAREAARQKAAAEGGY